MPRKLPPFLHREITRHKKPVWYFRRGKGPRIRMPGEFNSVEFNAAYDAALKGARPARLGPAGLFHVPYKPHDLRHDLVGVVDRACGLDRSEANAGRACAASPTRVAR